MINLIAVGRFPQKLRMEKFAYDVINHFFKRDRKENITIAIEMQTSLDGNDAGYCVDYGVHNHGSFGRKNGKIRTIAITLSRNYINAEEDEKFPYTVREIASTLAHELVHAKQYIRRELTAKSLNLGLGALKNDKSLEYKDLPWEKEAYGLEEELLALYW